MIQQKIIFTGPTGAGKTTAIHSISDVSPIKIDAAPSGKAKARKPAKTVAMDYGIINLDNGEKIHLYETPGQEQFDFTLDNLVKGGIGLIILLDNSRANPFEDIWFFMQAFKKFIVDTNVAIGVTKMDISNTPTIADYHNQLQVSDLKPPIFALDARVKDDVSLLVQALLYSINPSLTE